jgi:glycosyltransferase involved in cell wall biosynthesis
MAVGGVETTLVALARELTRLGHDVFVASSGGPLVPELQESGARHFKHKISLRAPAALFATAVSLRRIIKENRIQVAHSMSAAASVALSLAPRGACRYVVSPMGLQNSVREPPWVTAVRKHLLTMRAERMLVISDEIDREFRNVARDRLQRARGDVVGIDAQAFALEDDGGAKFRAELEIASANVVTTIGALHPRKSHELFIQAASEVVATFPSTTFLIVGAGPEQRTLETLTSRLGLNDNVRLLGQRRDIRRILAATNVYVKPGIVEGFVGVTVLEAMAANVPVVAFDTLDVRAAIVPEVTGILVPSSDTTALSNAICRLLADPQFAEALAVRARVHVGQRFGITTVATNLVHFYSEGVEA